MPGFVETKKSLEQSFAQMTDMDLREYRIISYDTTGGAGVLTIHGSEDFDNGQAPQVEMKFHRCMYIEAPMELIWVKFSLAAPQDTNRIQRIVGDTPVWVVCIAMDADGGPPFQYFVAAEKVEVSIR